jgi:hypothetical protein
LGDQFNLRVITCLAVPGSAGVVVLLMPPNILGTSSFHHPFLPLLFSSLFHFLSSHQHITKTTSTSSNHNKIVKMAGSSQDPVQGLIANLSFDDKKLEAKARIKKQLERFRQVISSQDNILQYACCTDMHALAQK